MSSNSWKKIILGIIFLIFSLFYVFVFFRNTAITDTMIFNIAHIKSLEDISTLINFDYWNHSGSLLNLYSPWLTILPGALFLSQNLLAGFLLFMVVITYLTSLSAYYYMKKFSHNTFEALLFSAFYTFSLNRFFLVYQEQRLENYLVLIFLPMVYFGIYQIFSLHSKKWLTFALGLSLIIWTSPIVSLGVLLTILPMPIILFFNRQTHSVEYFKKWFLQILKSGLLTGVLTVGFWGVMLEDQVTKKLIQADYAKFNFIKWFNGMHLQLANQYLLLAIAILFVLLLLFIFWTGTFSYKIIILELIPLTYLLLFGINIKGINLSRLNLSFQMIFSLFVIVVGIRVILMLFQESPVILRLLILLVAILGLGYGNFLQAKDLQTTSPMNLHEKIDYKKYVVNYHDQAVTTNNQFLINGQSQEIQFFTKKNEYWVQYYNPKAVTMDIPVQNYAGINVTINNEKVRVKNSKRGTVQIRTQPNRNIIEIHSSYTPLGILMLAINLVGIIILIYVWVRQKRSPSKKIMVDS